MMPSEKFGAWNDNIAENQKRHHKLALIVKLGKQSQNAFVAMDSINTVREFIGLIDHKILKKERNYVLKK